MARRRSIPRREARSLDVPDHVTHLFQHTANLDGGLLQAIAEGADRFGPEFAGVWERLATEVFAGLYAPEWLAPLEPESAEDAWLASMHSVIATTTAASAADSTATGNRRDPRLVGTLTQAVLRACLDALAFNEGEEGLPPSPNQDEAATLRTEVREQVEEIMQEEQEVGRLLEGAGWSASGDTEHGHGAEGRAALLMALHRNPHLQAILELAGRFAEQARAKRRGQPERGPGMLVGTELGGIEDLGRLLPAEAGMLRTKARMVKLRDLVERRAQVYRQVRRPPGGRGPLIACLDLSGSMAALSGGGQNRHPRHVWAKGVLAGTYHLAMDEGRPFVWILFDDEVMQVQTFTEPDPLRLAEVLVIEPAGGTSFQAPINAAAEVLENDPRLLQGADLLFFTDGVAPDPDLTRLREIDPEIQIRGFAFLGGDAPGKAPLAWCDEVTYPTNWSEALDASVK